MRFSIALVAPAVLQAAAAPAYDWPDAGMGQRTTKHVEAGKRAGRHIACDVCSERVMALFPVRAEGEEIGRIFEAGSISEWLGDVKELCAMKPLANLFKQRRLDVSPKPDGTATLELVDGVPFYEEINTSDLVFHWKSFAVREACTEVFRRDGDAVAAHLEKAYNALVSKDKEGEEPLKLLSLSSQNACRRAKACRAADKLMSAAKKWGASPLPVSAEL